MFTRSGAAMPAFNRWILFLLLIVAGFGGFTAWSFLRAARGASAVTDPDYYSHGLRYGRTVLEQKAAAALGWEAAPELQGRILTIGLRDNGRRAVTGADGLLILLGPGARHIRNLGLREASPGTYRAELPADLRGEQPVEIVFQREGARLSQRLLLSVK